MPAGEAAGWLLAMRAAYRSGRVQTVCNRFAGLRAHYGIEWRMLDTGTRLVPDPGLTTTSLRQLQCCSTQYVSDICKRNCTHPRRSTDYRLLGYIGLHPLL
jgi:hypothetical protein